MRIFKLVITTIILMSIPDAAPAQVARLVHYQGSLTVNDSTSFPGTADLTFKLYDRPVAGEPIWTETHENVKIQDSNYGVLLGSKTPLKLSFYEYFLEVETEGLGGQGRVMIVGSGYNFRLWFLFAAYTIVWLAIFFYVLSIARRQKKIITGLEALQQAQN